MTRPARAGAAVLSAPRPAHGGCRYFIDLVYERCRIRLHEGKEALIKRRLEKHYLRLGLSSLDEYARFLETAGTEDEFTTIVDALTTNFTEFLREREHFDFLVKTALPATLKPCQSRFRIWSAACSSGEEAYTIAMFLTEHFPPSKGWEWSVCASDISTRMLAAAQQAVYPEERIKSVPPDWLRKYFDKGYGASAGLVRVKPELARRVEFHQVNLTAPLPRQRSFEAIFCRNVMIYFDAVTQEQVIGGLCNALVPGGYLFTGHSESLNGLCIPVRYVRPSIYLKPT